jgi:hypothetical protein
LFLDIRIVDNDILGMGASGIGSPDLPPQTQGMPIVLGIEVFRNRITGCAQLARSEAQANAVTPLLGLGGIALLVAGYANVRDNWIAMNGTSFVPSICGVWIGAGFGVVIERNDILDNGPRIPTQQPLEAGPRAGIRVELALPALSLNLANNVGAFESEFPALRAHDNVVVAPSGPALAAFAFGPVTVANNELTSGMGEAVSARGPWPIDVIRAVLGGAAVLVFDLGALSEITSGNVDYSTIALHQNGLASSASNKAVATPFTSGDILFEANRVLLNFPDAGQTILISSVLLLGFADVGVGSNQLIARTGNHLLATNILAVGVSVRLEGNRCQDRFDAGFSGVTVGFLNATTDNQGSRCFYAAGAPNLLVDTGNRSWVDVISRGFCAEQVKSMDTIYAKAGYVPHA